MAKTNVAVPADYFLRRVRQDYRDHRAALAREFLQNSVDAGATRIEFECVSVAEGNWHLRVTDDGRGASREIIENKLLILGRSGKESETNAVGGFGLAKELLFFSWPRWTIRTRNLFVEGEAGTYEIHEVAHETEQQGFTAVIAIPTSEQPDSLLSSFRAYLRRCETAAEVYVNGDRIFSSWRRPVRALRNLGFGKVYRDKSSHDPYILVRHHGVLMFTEYNGHDEEAGRFIVELSGKSIDLLTSNRDGLREDSDRQALHEFLQALVIDRRKATEEDEEHDVIEFFDAEGAVAASAGHVVEAGSPGRGPGVEVRGLVRDVEVGGGGHMQALVREGGRLGGPALMIAAQSGIDSIPKRKVGIDRAEIPDYGVPHFAIHTRGRALAKVRAFLQTETAGRVVRAWQAACQGVLGAVGKVPDAIGFSFTATAEAECLKTGSRSALLVRPTGLPKSFISEELIDLAIHEVAHLYSTNGHSEAWALEEVRIRRALRLSYRTVRTAVERALRSGGEEA